MGRKSKYELLIIEFNKKLKEKCIEIVIEEKVCEEIVIEEKVSKKKKNLVRRTPEQNKAYYLANKDKYLKYNTKNYEKNREDILKQKRDKYRTGDKFQNYENKVFEMSVFDFVLKTDGSIAKQRKKGTVKEIKKEYYDKHKIEINKKANFVRYVKNVLNKILLD